MNKFTTLIFSVMIATAAVAQSEEQNARDLFYSPTKALFGSGSSASTITSNERAGQNFDKADNENLGDISNYYEKLENPGVTYSIELLRKGSNTPKRVSSGHVFKSGDRIRVHVSANGDGYMHALHKGSSGNTMIIPISTGGRVTNGQNITIPSASGWLRFDNQKGLEKLDLVFASHGNANQMGIVPTSNNTASLIANIQQVAAKYSVSKSLLEFEQSGEKDLILEDGGVANLSPGVINRTSRPAAEITQAVYTAPANYAVNTASEPVAIKINLKHQ